MPDIGLHFDQVVRVEMIVFGLLAIVARKTFDSVDIVPKMSASQSALRAFDAVQTPGAAISLCRDVLGKRNPPH